MLFFRIDSMMVCKRQERVPTEKSFSKHVAQRYDIFLFHTRIQVVFHDLDGNIAVKSVFFTGSK